MVATGDGLLASINTSTLDIGFKVNDAKVADERALVTLADLDADGRIKVAKGKSIKLAVPA